MSIGAIIDVQSSIISWEASENSCSNRCELEEKMIVGRKSQQLKHLYASATSA